RRPGVLDQLKQLLPGWLRPQGPLEQLGLDERKIRRMEAIINSMTPQERRHPEILNASRKRRIARGSGTTVQEVNELLRYYRQVKAMMEQVAKWEGKFRGLSK
ncbi:MAG TPA: signal recognition particle protein, partial [Armatimonadetes bacterium]|nr:signal recognition particle protein [Armatimonadota bacterium]